MSATNARGRVIARFAAVPLAFAALVSADAARAETPQINYMLQCRGCHLADGSGAPGRVPTFRDTVGRFLEVLGGREYLVRVPGSAQSRLDDADLAAVLNWIVREYGPAEIAADFEPFSAGEVARYRSSPLVAVEARRRELRQLMGKRR